MILEQGVDILELRFQLCGGKAHRRGDPDFFGQPLPNRFAYHEALGLLCVPRAHPSRYFST